MAQSLLVPRRRFRHDAEGAGAAWPGSDAALLAIIPLTALLAIGLVTALRLARRRSSPVAARGPAERVEALR